MKTRLELLLIAALFVAAQARAATQIEQPPFQRIQDMGYVFEEKPNVDFEVLYFFNLNCSSCIKFEKFLHPWFLNQKKNLSFRVIPSPVKDEWQLANNTYFAAKAIDPSLTFWDIMGKQESLNTRIYTCDSSNAFLKHLSKNSDNENTLALFSDEVFANAKVAKDVYNKLAISGTPTLILISKKHAAYEISPEFTHNYRIMLETIDALIGFNTATSESK